MMIVMETQSILFVQGAGRMQEPDGSGRLAAYLASELGPRYRVIAPEMPNADAPRYKPWRDRIEQELEVIDEDVIIVGHSFGGSVVLKYFAEGSYHRRVRGVFLISVPDWGPDGWAYEEFAVPDDVGSKLPTSRIFLYHSRDDPEVPFSHLAHYQQHLPTATARAIAGSEHSFIEGLPVLAEDIRRLRL
jgi:predicted alpha/beta hydrolase family esterase